MEEILFNNKGIKKIKVDVDNVGDLDFSVIYPLRLDNGKKRWNSYIAVVSGIDKDGNELREYIEEYNTDSFKTGTIIRMSAFDRYKNRTYVQFYIVGHISDDDMELIYGNDEIDDTTTYRKAYYCLYGEKFRKPKA